MGRVPMQKLPGSLVGENFIQKRLWMYMILPLLEIGHSRLVPFARRKYVLFLLKMYIKSGVTHTIWESRDIVFTPRYRLRLEVVWWRSIIANIFLFVVFSPFYLLVGSFFINLLYTTRLFPTASYVWVILQNQLWAPKYIRNIYFNNPI